MQALPLYSSDNSETIYGYNSKANVINGLDGDNTICGGNANNTLNGGAGNDHLKGGNGNDIYEFIGNFGQDSICLDINKENISLKRELYNRFR